MKEFARNLNEQLQVCALTQTALAKILGVAQQTVNRWANGVNEPDLSMLTEICRVLDASPDEMLGWEKQDPFNVTDKKTER